jgi:hypothetical protein
MEPQTISRRDLLRAALAGAAAAGAVGGLARTAWAAPVTIEQIKKNGEIRIGG